jgi:hypothetical protein
LGESRGDQLRPVLFEIVAAGVQVVDVFLEHLIVVPADLDGSFDVLVGLEGRCEGRGFLLAEATQVLLFVFELADGLAVNAEVVLAVGGGKGEDAALEGGEARTDGVQFFLQILGLGLP